MKFPQLLLLVLVLCTAAFAAGHVDSELAGEEDLDIPEPMAFDSSLDTYSEPDYMVVEDSYAMPYAMKSKKMYMKGHHGMDYYKKKGCSKYGSKKYDSWGRSYHSYDRSHKKCGMKKVAKKIMKGFVMLGIIAAALGILLLIWLHVIKLMRDLYPRKSVKKFLKKHKFRR